MADGTPVRVLVVEDAGELAEAIRRSLEREGMTVEAVRDAEAGLQRMRTTPPDVVIMDLTLPGMDGVEACRRLRTFSDAYVVMLTGRGSETDRIIGLASGADDYMTKPFYASELAARIRAMLRRPRTTAGRTNRLEIGPLAIDLEAREVTVEARPVELSRTEYELLAALARTPRAPLSRNQLLQQVWGADWFGDDHVVDVHISNLRRKLGDDPRHPRFVRTVRGYGFRLGTGEG